MIFTKGIRIIRKHMPTTAPKKDDAAAKPTARPASPRRAMGWPSKQVAALGASPGMLSRIAGTEPPSVAAPIIPAIRNMAVSASHPKVKVMPMVRPARNSPGSAPRMSPDTAPTASTSRFAGWLSMPRAWRRGSHMDSVLERGPCPYLALAAFRISSRFALNRFS